MAHSPGSSASGSLGHISAGERSVCFEDLDLISGSGKSPKIK